MNIEKDIKECFRNVGIFLSNDCEDDVLTHMDIDSFTFVSLMIEIEDYFKITFPDEMLSKEILASFTGFAKLIEQLRTEV